MERIDVAMIDRGQLTDVWAIGIDDCGFQVEG